MRGAAGLAQRLLRCAAAGSQCSLAAPGRPHDAHQDDPTLAFQLAHISTGPTQPTCIGVFRDTARPVYGEAMEAQIEQATDRLGAGDLGNLLHSGDTWQVK